MVDDTNKEKVNLGTVKGENGNTAVPYWVGSQLGFRLEHNPTDMPKLKDLIGETGAQGIQGNPAAIKGTLTSPNDLPTTNNKDGDMYIINDGFENGILYQYYNNIWNKVGQIIGEKGEQGQTGLTYLLDGLFTFTVDENGDLYSIVPEKSTLTKSNFELDDDKNFYLVIDPVNAPAEKILIGNTEGKQGPPGACTNVNDFYFFYVDDDGNLYVDGDAVDTNDFYYDSTTGDLYKNYTGENKLLLGNVRGPQGLPGNTLFNISNPYASASDLPATGATNTIYIVNTSKTETENIYSEYIWIPATSTYEKFGDLGIDMSSKANVADVYAKTETYSKPEVDTKLSSISDSVVNVTTANYGDNLTQDLFNSYISSDILHLKTEKANASDVYTKAEVDAKLGSVETALNTILGA